MFKAVLRLAGRLVLVGAVAGSAAFSATLTPPVDGRESSGAPAAGPETSSARARLAPAPVFANSVTSGRQALWLRERWGIDDVHVRWTGSGSIVRFSYRVVDVAKAKILNDRNVNPYLVVKKTGDKLEVPTTEKIGKLRQTPLPRNGREYWMVFTNTGRLLSPGDHVDIVIGSFRAEELVIESSGPVRGGPKS